MRAASKAAEIFLIFPDGSAAELHYTIIVK